MYNSIYKIIVINWKEFNLFYHVPGYNITSTIHNNNQIANKICRFKIYKIERLFNLNNILFDYIWCDLLVEMIKSERFIKNVKNYITNIENNKKYYIIFYIYYQIYNKLLIVNIYINEKVNRFIKSLYSYPFTGIQIRVGNDDLHERKFSDETDIDIMINLAKKSNEYKIWYVTGDSQRYKYKLFKKYKNVIIYTLNKTKHYDKHKTDYNIIIEHEILSKSKYLLISKSTYGITALLKSGLLLYNIRNSYLINNRSSYDSKYFFLNISW